MQYQISIEMGAANICCIFLQILFAFHLSSTQKNYSPISFDNYHELTVIYQYMDYLAKYYPEVASVGVMGYTAEKREIKYIYIKSGIPNAKVVFIDGGIHAREWVAVTSVTYIMKELVENRDRLPSQLLGLDFYLAPVINPDGYEYSRTTDRMWRKNRSGSGKCLGVDINRNFDFYFGQARNSSNPCALVYAGKAPNSELETKAFIRFILKLKGRLEAYISFHSYEQLILIPYSYGTVLAPDLEEMNTVADEATKAIKEDTGAEYKFGNGVKLNYPASGTSTDWVKANIGTKFVYCIELRDEGTYGFLLPPDQIIPTAEDALAAVKVIAIAASKD